MAVRRYTSAAAKSSGPISCHQLRKRGCQCSSARCRVRSPARLTLLGMRSVRLMAVMVKPYRDWRRNAAVEGINKGAGSLVPMGDIQGASEGLGPLRPNKSPLVPTKSSGDSPWFEAQRRIMANHVSCLFERRSARSDPVPVEFGFGAAAVHLQGALLADRIGAIEDPVLPGGQPPEDARLHAFGHRKSQARFQAGQCIR